MFDPAAQPPGETLEAARASAAATEDSRPTDNQADSGRRYTAEDFRSLMARLTKGAAGAPARAAASPHAAAETASPPPSAAEAEPSAVATIAVRQDEHDLDIVAVSHDDAHLPEPGQAERPIADPLPQDNSLPEVAGEGPQQDFCVDVEAAEAGGADIGSSEAEADAIGVEPSTPDILSPEAAFEPGEAELADMAIEPTEGGESAVEAPLSAVVVADSAFEPDLQSGETARMLLDIMAMPAGAVQPQERALAGDTLLRLVSRMPVSSLIALCDRLCIMEAPPPLLVRRLIHHDNIDVAGPLLERCPGISDQELMTMINMGSVVALRLIARRRHLSPALTDALIRHGDASVMLTVVRNPGAALSHEAFNVLAETAKSRTSLQAPLATRADTPGPIAFELFWSLPPQLRRYVLSRFLTESATLDRILKIAHALEESNGDGSGGPKMADKAAIKELVALVADGNTTEAAQKLAALAGIGGANAERIISDSEGEPLTVAMKAIGLSRTRFAALIADLRDAPAAPLRSNRRIVELQNLFDSLSFTKARVLLTYWDWAVEQSGPYSGRAV